MQKIILNALCWVLAVAPLVAAGVAYLLLPETIPTHFNFHLEADAWGGKRHVLLFGGIMAFAGVICALCATFTEKLLAMGLVNGVSTAKGTRIWMLVAIIICDVAFFWGLSMMAAGA